MATLQSQNN